MSQVEFFCDLSCPWSYLALVRLRDATDRNAASIRFRPVSVDEVLTTENPDLRATRLADNPAKAAWQQADLQQWAAMWGMTLTEPGYWPFDGSAAGAAVLAAEKLGKGTDYALGLYRACFAEGADIRQTQTLADIAVKAGLEREDFVAELEQPGYALQVKEATVELISRGGFGTPTMFVGDEMFFGNDRVTLVEWALGPVRDAAFVMPGQHSVY